MSLANRTSAALRAFFETPKRPAPVRVGPAPRPEASLFVREPAREAARREDAMSLMDDECVSYVIVMARGRVDGEIHVDVRVALDEFAWPAMAHTLGRLVLEGDRVHGG